MAFIRKQYGVPIARGMTARCLNNVCKVTAVRNAHVRLLHESGARISAHPLDIDYLVDGEWVLASDLTERYDARDDRFNEALNAMPVSEDFARMKVILDELGEAFTRTKALLDSVEANL